MGGHAGHRYVGPRWEKPPSLGPDLIRDIREGELDTTSSSHGSESTEEICGCATSTLRIRGWGSRLLESDA